MTADPFPMPTVEKMIEDLGLTPDDTDVPDLLRAASDRCAEGIKAAALLTQDHVLKKPLDLDKVKAMLLSLNDVPLLVASLKATRDRAERAEAKLRHPSTGQHDD